jgi:carbon storage regulator CsrA
MLVLTRKSSEQILIGDQVVVTILKVQGHTVRIGIEAPRNVRVLRAELPKFETGSADSIVCETRMMTSPDKTTTMDRRDRSADRSAPAKSRSVESAHPGEQAFAATFSPLAARLQARRVPGVSSTPLPTHHYQTPGAGVRT